MAAAVAIGAIFYAVHYNYVIRRSEQRVANLRETMSEETAMTNCVDSSQETEKTENEKLYCESVYDFAELQEQNGDVYAWITVPGTQVDYPVLQNETDNFYLNHNMDYSQGYPGCIYTNLCNAKDFLDYNTVLYGHNMKNGTMFGSLHKFEDEDFFAESRLIYVYTTDKRLTYEIYAAVKFTDVYIPAYYDVKTTKGRNAFLVALDEACEDSNVSHIAEETEVRSEDKLITLSTCVSGESEKRYIVVGVQKEEACIK